MFGHLLPKWPVMGLMLWCICGLSNFTWSLDGETSSVDNSAHKADNPRDLPPRASAVFAGGCFWCVESDFEKAPGVVDVISGYSGGRTENPNYDNYASGGHREVVFVVYDPTQVTYAGLVEYLIKHIDPINRIGQFKDIGKQYSPAIYYNTQEEKLAAQSVIDAINAMKVFRGKLNVALEKRQAFWPAEDYHQNYHHNNGLKYQFFRLSSGRDAYVQQHWGVRANKLELEGAYPAANSSSSTSASEQSASVTSTSRATTETPAATSGSASAAPAWTKYHKPSDEDLRTQLTKLQYGVTQHDETEPAYRNNYWDNHKAGIYVDILSGEPLFSSSAKFESGTGWPSFVAPIDPEAVLYVQDHKLFYTRIEVRSRYGDSHLGHLFDDGPVERGGKRYCMNSAAMRFIPKQDMAAQGYADYLPLVAE